MYAMSLSKPSASKKSQNSASIGHFALLLPPFTSPREIKSITTFIYGWTSAASNTGSNSAMSQLPISSISSLSIAYACRSLPHKSMISTSMAEILVILASSLVLMHITRHFTREGTTSVLNKYGLRCSTTRDYFFATRQSTASSSSL